MESSLTNDDEYEYDIDDHDIDEYDVVSVDRDEYDYCNNSNNNEDDEEEDEYHEEEDIDSVVELQMRANKFIAKIIRGWMEERLRDAIIVVKMTAPKTDRWSGAAEATHNQRVTRRKKRRGDIRKYRKPTHNLT